MYDINRLRNSNQLPIYRKYGFCYVVEPVECIIIGSLSLLCYTNQICLHIFLKVDMSVSSQ